MIETTVAVPRYVIYDRHLSLRAKGLYALLTAHGPVMLNVDELELSREDAEQVRPVLQELSAAGLICWTQD